MSILVDYQAERDSAEASFNYSTGVIDLQNGLATLTVPSGYRFLGSEQSAYVLADLWGNPPTDVIGMLFPDGIRPTQDSGFTYAVGITYSEEGFIDDEDAQDLDYDELLEEMQQDILDNNSARIRAGYGSLELVGWGSPPFYDAANKKLHWAKELKFDGSETNTLNYNIRILGRRGYLELNVIGDIDVLPLVKNDVNRILASVEFNEGNTYADFDPDIDAIAAYGIGGLIAGKVLLKLGFLAKFAIFFKGIGLFLVKAWKPIAIGVAAAAAGIKKFFFKSDKDKKKKKLFNPQEEYERKQQEQAEAAAAEEAVDSPEEVEEELSDDDQPEREKGDDEVTDADFDEDPKDKD